MPPLAYLRRSRVDTRRPGDVSHEQQLTAIRALAAKHGDDNDELVIIEDWGRSGRAEKQHLRAGFARLEDMVRSGEATAIYAYSTNRLARSLETLTRLAKLCAGIDPKTGKPIEGAKLVPIRVHDGQSPDVTNANGRLVFNILGSVAEWQAEWTQERMVEATKVRRARGDHMGPAPYGFRVVDGQLIENPDENIDDVIGAFDSAGTYVGAARRLNAQGIPTRAGRPWQASTVKQMIGREAPEKQPRRPIRGRPPRAEYRFAGLLRCPCGGTLSGTFYGGYTCKRALLVPGHPHPHTIAESKIRSWIEGEAARFRGPSAVQAGSEDDEARRTELDDRRARVVDAFLDGTVDKGRRDSELDAIDAELDRLSAAVRVVDVPQLDWAWQPGAVNAVLRALWDHVELDPELRPVRAEWLVPEWRAA
jgi:site-specific DNA recombinase